MPDAEHHRWLGSREQNCPPLMRGQYSFLAVTRQNGSKCNPTTGTSANNERVAGGAGELDPDGFGLEEAVEGFEPVVPAVA